MFFLYRSFFSRSFSSFTRVVYFSMVFFLWWKLWFLLNAPIHFLLQNICNFLWVFSLMKIFIITEWTHSFSSLKAFLLLQDVCIFLCFFSSYESFDIYLMNTFIFFSRSFSSTKDMYFSMVFYFLWWKFRFLLNEHIHFLHSELLFFYQSSSTRGIFFSMIKVSIFTKWTHSFASLEVFLLLQEVCIFLWFFSLIKFQLLLNEHIHFLLSKFFCYVL